MQEQVSISARQPVSQQNKAIPPIAEQFYRTTANRPQWRWQHPPAARGIVGAHHCCPGIRDFPQGFTNGGLQHITAVQVDQSGNVWAANNWASISPIVGGDGLVEFIGAAEPVETPKIGPQQQPGQ